MTTSAPDPETALVVAHPDDETLWLSAALARSGRIVLCFGAPWQRPAMAANRARAVAALGLPDLTDLAIPESGAGFSAGWRDPRPTATGLFIAEPEARARYDANHARLVERLRPVLAGCRTVFTHNPWGEYGHAEHVQVHRAVRDLQAEQGFAICVSNYAGPRAWTLARHLAAEPLWSLAQAVAPDRALARRLMRLYRSHGAWTWSAWHRWPRAETLYTLPPPGDTAPRRAFSGETLLDATRLRWLPPHLGATRILHPARRQDDGAPGDRVTEP